MALTVIRYVSKAKRGGRGRPSAKRLEQLNNQYSKVVSLDLKSGITRFGKRINYDHMANAVYSGNYKDVLKTIPLANLHGDILASMDRLGVSIEAASKIAAEQIPFGRGTDAGLLIDSRNNAKLDDYLDVRTGALVTNITDNMQVNVQTAIRAGIDNKETADQVADRIKQTGIGLNYRQADAMVRYEAAQRKAGIDGLELERRLETQAGKYLEQRCQMIARTEVTAGQNYAQVEVWAQAVNDGLLPRSAQKTWVVDGDPCDICKELEGQTIPIDEKFVPSVGLPVLAAPLHPHCRCTLDLSEGDKGDDHYGDGDIHIPYADAY